MTEHPADTYPYPDLNQLQARAESGEPIDIIDAFRAAIPDQAVAELADYKYGPGSNIGQVTDEALNSVRNNMGVRVFKDTFETVIGDSPNLDAFTWRTRMLVQTTRQGALRYYSDRPIHLNKGNMRGVQEVLSLDDVSVSLGTQLLRFCEINPNLTEQAIDSWVSVMAAAVGGSLGDKTIPQKTLIGRLYQPLERAGQGRRREGGEESSQADERIIREVYRRLALGNNATTSETTDHDLLLNEFENTDISSINPANLEYLFKALDGGSFKFKSPDRATKSSMNALQNLINSLVELVGHDQSSHARLVSEWIKIKRDAGMPIGNDDFIDLANKLKPAISRIRQERWPDEPVEDEAKGHLTNSMANFPKAVDRIAFFIMADPKIQNAAEQASVRRPNIPESFRLAEACTKVLAY